MAKLENYFIVQQIKTNTTMKLKLNWFTYPGSLQLCFKIETIKTLKP